jgi:hypothetical protein
MLKSVATIVIVACCIGCCGSCIEGLITPKDIHATLVSDTLTAGRPGTLTLTIRNYGDVPHTFGLLQFPQDIDEGLNVHSAKPAWVERTRHPLDEGGRGTAFVFDEPVRPGQTLTIEMQVSVATQVEPWGMVELCFDPDLIDTEADYYEHNLVLCTHMWHTFDVKGAPDRDLFDDAPRPRERKGRKARRR